MMNLKCWKKVDYIGNEKVIHVDNNTFTLQEANEDDIKIGELFISSWCVENNYEVLVNGPDYPRGYIDRRIDDENISFEELIICDGECLGIYYDECIMLINNKNTHYQEKYLGEFIIGPDRTRDVYNYYRLIKKRKEEKKRLFSE